MQSGRQTLASIEQALHQSQADIQQVDRQVQATSNELIELQREQTERFKKLAEIRMDQLMSGELAAGLDAATRRVGELLESRKQALAELEQDIRETRTAQEDLDNKRQELSGVFDRAAAALDEAEAAVQHKLAEDATYQAQMEKTSAAEHIAERAESKTGEAEQNRIDKGRPYEDDPLFSYLWKRGYGTSRYSANPLTRYLDKWVARLCNYHNARPNYSMLLDIPERLREHAENVRADADKEFEALKLLEETAAEKDGVPPLREALEEAERKIEEIDEEIQRGETRQAELMEKQTGFAAGEDEHFRQAVATLSDAIERENLDTLYRHAVSTPTAEDDVLVQEMAAARERAEQLRQALAEHKRLHERHLDRVRDLEEIRQRFKRQRYDSGYSRFGNAALITMVLNQFLQGLASRDDLWSTIKREQRHRRVESRPDFGSGGFPRRGGTWRTPFPGGGRGGGGFHTGGGF